MLLFWKMCNRALDLLDSLFEISSFRPGLWIYGHCVEYKCCNHALDPKGAGFDFLVASSGSLLQMWCGGCNGLACWMNCIRLFKLLTECCHGCVEYGKLYSFIGMSNREFNMLLTYC